MQGFGILVSGGIDIRRSAESSWFNTNNKTLSERKITDLFPRLDLGTMPQKYMVGILCEKPSAAANFAVALGGTKDKYTGKYNGENYTIVSARGHLYELKKPVEQVPEDKKENYKAWDVKHLPWDERDMRWVYEQKPGAKETIDKITSICSKCDEVVIATDVDPSGEGFLLAAEILLNNNIRPATVSRMYFVDESEKELQKAFKTRKVVPDITKDPEYLMAYYRSRWDFMSMQWTRIALAYSDGQSVLRQGRLKSAMVTVVGDQLKLIRDYKPIPFFQNKFKDENGVVYSFKDEPTFPKKEDVPLKYGPSAVVLDTKQMKSTPPPKLLDLASLAARLAPKGFSSEEVLNTYQKMYEAQIVSYPRTEDKVISPEQFNDLLPYIGQIADVVGVNLSLLTHNTPRSTHVKVGGAHGANRPGIVVPDSLDDLNEYGRSAPLIYKELATSYLAMLAGDYEYEHQTAHLEKYPQFKGGANIPKKMGWKEVFNAEEEPDEEENAKGVGKNAEPYVHEGVNPKPANPTMKWLMKQLEKHNVGTGATKTSTYADVTSEKYKFPLLVDKKGKITMTHFGEMSYRMLPGTHIGNISITKKVEEDMKAIADGKASADACLSEIQQFIRDDLELMKQNGINMRKELDVKLKTELENQKERFTGTWNGKPVTFNRAYAGYRFSDEECQKLCDGETITVMGLKTKTGKTMNVKGILSVQEYKGRKYIGFLPTVQLNDDGTEKEPQTEAPNEYCRGTWKKKEVKFKRTWSGHEFTDQECEELLAGKEITFEAVSQKTGNTYTVIGKLATQSYNGNKFVGFKPDFKKKGLKGEKK